eukprot:1273120-Pyramimonas_sp.AAC.1
MYASRGRAHAELACCHRRGQRDVRQMRAVIRALATRCALGARGYTQSDLPDNNAANAECATHE